MTVAPVSIFASTIVLSPVDGFFRRKPKNTASYGSFNFNWSIVLCVMGFFILYTLNVYFTYVFCNCFVINVVEAFPYFKVTPNSICDKTTVKDVFSLTSDVDELSVSNMKVLDKWIDKCKDIESFDLSDLSHEEAWQMAKSKTDQTGEDTKITLYDMAKAAGANDAMLGVIRERQINSRELQWIHELTTLRSI